MIEAGYIEVANRSVRPFAYKVTRYAERYRRLLSHEHCSWLLGGLWGRCRAPTPRMGWAAVPAPFES